MVNILALDKVMTVKRTYTMVRTYCPENELPHQSFIFDEDEYEACEEFIRLCIQHKVTHEVEILRPH